MIANIQVKNTRAPQRKACRCSRVKSSRTRATGVAGLGCGGCTSRAMGDYAIAEDVGMGSWLSSAFRSITGTKLSSVVAPIAGVVGGAIGGPAGAALGAAIAGGVSGSGGGGSSGSSSAGSTQGSTPGGIVGTNAWNTNDWFNGVARVVDAARGNSSAGPTQQEQQRAAAAAAEYKLKTDNIKTVAIAGGIGIAALIAGVLITRK